MLRSLQSEHDALQSDLTTAETRHEDDLDTIAGLDNDIGELRQRITALETDLENATRGLDEAENTRTELQDELATIESQRAEQAQQIEELEALLASRGSTLEELEGELAETKGTLERAARPDLLVAATAHDGTVDPQTLWDLEVSRAERRWRHSVATNPESDENPFEGVDDQLRLAVEIEAAALREEVGAFITIDWQAGPIADPARRHLVLRVAQEVLASAAREPEASQLVISGDSDVKIKLVPADDEDGTVINLVPPRITSDLVDVQQSGGLDIIVRAI